MALNSDASTSGVQKFSLPTGFAQLVQTTTGKHLLITSSPPHLSPSGAHHTAGQINIRKPVAKILYSISSIWNYSSSSKTPFYKQRKFTQTAICPRPQEETPKTTKRTKKLPGSFRHKIKIFSIWFFTLKLKSSAFCESKP